MKKDIFCLRKVLNERQQKIVEDNVNLVYCIVNRYFDGNEDLYDLGMIGLVEAVLNFDESRGVSLSTYAWKVIYNKVLLYLRNDKNPKDTISLDRDFEDAILVQQCKNEEMDENLIEDEEKALLYTALSKLSERERYILINYYGLYSQEPRKVKDIAEELHVTTVRVHYIIRRTKQKLKMLMEDKNDKH